MHWNALGLSATQCHKPFFKACRGHAYHLPDERNGVLDSIIDNTREAVIYLSDAGMCSFISILLTRGATVYNPQNHILPTG